MGPTITFGNNLSNSLQTVRVISYFEFHLNEDNRDGAKCFEEVLDATLRTNTTFVSGLFLSMKVNCLTRWLKIYRP